MFETAPSIVALWFAGHAHELAPADSWFQTRICEAPHKANDIPVTEAIGPALDPWWKIIVREGFESDFRVHPKASSRS